VIEIGRCHTRGGDVAACAREHLKHHYAFGIEPVLFKPTMAIEQPFRNTFDAALSYFVGGNSDFTEDNGFALRPWTSIRFASVTISCRGDTAQSMGYYSFTDETGAVVKAEFSFVYLKTNDGRLLITLHHSSLPRPA
jgi:hypothetical protein